MKKKAIEKIPYLTLKNVSWEKDVKYIGVTAIKTISKEEYLFLEVYRNNQEAREVPAVRVVLSKKDFGTYFPESGEWSRKKIIDREHGHGPVWYRGEGNRAWIRDDLGKVSILQRSEDLERIKGYCGSHAWRKERWWEYIERVQSSITAEERDRARERKRKAREQALEDRIAHTGPLPEKQILERADALYFQEEHHLYYKKHGSWATVACSKCGGVTDARWKDGVSFESGFQRRIEEPREHQYGTCPMCGTRGEYKCQGKVKGLHSKKMNIFLGQKYKGTGMVLRYVEVEKRWHLGLAYGEKGPEMVNAYEELSGIEIARAYFEQGKKAQIDYHKRSFGGGDFWDDCNLYGIGNITVGRGLVMKETYEEMKGTIFQYSALEEYARAVGKVNPVDYFERYQQIPQLEMLVKLGLDEIVEKLVENRRGIHVCEGANRPDTFLGIRKERIRQLAAKKGDVKLLDAMKTECRMQQNWTGQQLEDLAETGLSRGQVELALRYMGIQKLLNRIGKYARCDYGTGCSSAMERIRRAATTYADYLNMRESLGYDLSNTVYQYPRSLGAAHERMVMETNKGEMDKRMQEVKKKFGNIRHSYRSLRKKYYYEDSEYVIRPARSAEEIVMEGRLLHHCVGGNNYLEKHNNGESYILLLRRKDDPETPYITVEIGAESGRVLQWYGEYDRKPDDKHMQGWIDSYVMRMKNGWAAEVPQADIA